MSHACERRAYFLRKTRQFFDERGVLEVDTPILNLAAQIDSNIEPMCTDEGLFLHTSPEYGMKKILAQCPKDIYQICHVFRRGEVSPIHTPEFTMIEWYQVNVSFETHLQANLDLIALFLEGIPCHSVFYQTLYQTHTGLDPMTASLEALRDSAYARGFYGHISHPSTCLDFLWQAAIEPHLQNLVVVTGFPESQAQLARAQEGIAERFEIYCDGIELANGYHELNVSQVVDHRLQSANAERQVPLPLDTSFIAACDALPDCWGTALGFDRLVMLSNSLKVSIL